MIQQTVVSKLEDKSSVIPIVDISIYESGPNTVPYRFYYIEHGQLSVLFVLAMI